MMLKKTLNKFFNEQITKKDFSYARHEYSNGTNGK